MSSGKGEGSRTRETVMQKWSRKMERLCKNPVAQFLKDWKEGGDAGRGNKRGKVQ
jgi:hypothetical protein